MLPWQENEIYKKIKLRGVMTFLMEQCKKCLAHIFYFLEKNTSKLFISLEREFI